MYTLYHAPEHGSLIIILALESAGIPYNVKTVDRAAGELDTLELRKLNPVGGLPILLTPQGPIFETAAILLWLGDKHNFIPQIDDPDRAVLLTWLIYIVSTPLSDLRQLIYPQGHMSAEEIEASYQTLVGRMKTHFALLNKIIGRNERLADPKGIIAPILSMMMRWSVLLPPGKPQWFFAKDYDFLHDLALDMEASPHVQRTLKHRGYEATAFSAPVSLKLDIPEEGLQPPMPVQISFSPEPTEDVKTFTVFPKIEPI